MDSLYQSRRVAVYTLLQTRYMLPEFGRAFAVQDEKGGACVATDVKIEEKVFGIVAEQLQVPKEEIRNDKSFINDLQADSLDIVELVMEFEDEFKINIPDEDYEKIKTVGDAVKYIEEKGGGQQ